MAESNNANPNYQFGVRGKMKLIGKDQMIPQGAIQMTRDHVMNVQLGKIKRWKPASDMWPFHYGDYIYGISTLMTSALINHHFRSHFRLGNKAFISSYMLTVALPSIMSSVVQKMAVLPDLLNTSSCPTCLEVRSGLLHTTVSTFYPVLPAVLSSLILCKRYDTHLGRDGFHPGFRYAFKTTFTTRNAALFFVAANFGVGYLMTYFRGSSIELMILKEAEQAAKRKISADDL